MAKTLTRVVKKQIQRSMVGAGVTHVRRVLRGSMRGSLMPLLGSTVVLGQLSKEKKSKINVVVNAKIGT